MRILDPEFNQAIRRTAIRCGVPDSPSTRVLVSVQLTRPKGKVSGHHVEVQSLGDEIAYVHLKGQDMFSDKNVAKLEKTFALAGKRLKNRGLTS